MVICITGATGFIGKRLVSRLLAAGNEVRYLTRNNKQPLSGARAFLADVNDSINKLTPFFKNVDVVYHCAGEVENESLMYQTHVDGTHNLLAALKNANELTSNPVHWIQLSSCGAYGQAANAVGEERHVDEAAPDSPVGVYETSKAESDALIVEASTQYDWFKYTIFRPSIVFGVGMRSTAIARLTSLIKKNMFFYIGHKEAVANYVHVDDVVNAMVLSLNQSSALNETFIVANDCKLSEIVNAISGAFSVAEPRWTINEFLLRVLLNTVNCIVKIPINSSHIDVMVRKTHYSNAKLRKYLDWAPVSAASTQVATYVCN